MPAYDLLALDLDGTLLSPDGSVSPANRAALDRARAAGVRLLPCTGRGRVECAHILRAIDHTAEVVTAGGSITADARTGATIHRFAMAPALVAESVGHIHDAGFCALVLKDSAAAGFDYLVLSGTAGHELDPVTEWWFAELGVTARFAATLADDEHPEQTVRVGLCAEADACEPVTRRLHAALGHRATLHHFGAVVGAHLMRNADGPRRVHIMEVFDPRSSKWAAISEHCARHSIDPARVAAIGDEINDLPMIEHAGLGIAMGNAIPDIKAVARRQTLPNTADGVAYAIDRILAGEW